MQFSVVENRIVTIQKSFADHKKFRNYTYNKYLFKCRKTLKLMAGYVK